MKWHDALIGSDLHEVAHLLRLEIDKRVRVFDLTRLKWLALEAIERRPQLTQTDLADELGLGTATVGRLIDRLEKRKLVERRSDERDRRSYRLVLTAKAFGLLNDLGEVASSLKADLLDGLSDGEIKTLRDSPKKLRSNLSRKTAAILAPVCLLQRSRQTELDPLVFDTLAI